MFDFILTVSTILLLTWILAFFKVKFVIWLCFVTALSIVSYFFNIISLSACIIIVSVNIVLFFVFGYPKTRKALITKYIYKVFKKSTRPLTNTEKEAIAAFDAYWEKELFTGTPDWNKLLHLPSSTLSEDEINFLTNEVKILCEMIDEWEITNKILDLPSNVWNYLKEKRFFGMHIPKKFGGLGFSAIANSTIVQKIATKSFTAAVTVMVPNSLGPAELLLKYGTKAQCEEYLPKLASGEYIPCFGLTSPGGGSDVSNMQDYGVVCYGDYNGRNVLGIKLNWDKRYITLAPIATLLGIAFKLYDPDNLLNENENENENENLSIQRKIKSLKHNKLRRDLKKDFKKDIEKDSEKDIEKSLGKDLGITICLVPSNLKGIEIGKRHLPLNSAFMNGPTKGKDVFVPINNIIGESKMIGKGWKMLVECLAIGKGISLPAVSSAAVKTSFKTVGAYVAIRQQFKRSIGDFDGIQEVMARIGGYTYLLESARLFTINALGQNLKPGIAGSIVKYHMTELSRTAINDAMDIHAGKTIVMGRKNYLAQIYQNIPIAIAVEGANIITRCVMIFGQALIKCHPYMKKQINSLSVKNYKDSLRDFDKAFFGHISYFVSNFARLFTHSLITGLFYLLPKTFKTLFAIPLFFNVSFALPALPAIPIVYKSFLAIKSFFAAIFAFPVLNKIISVVWKFLKHSSIIKKLFNFKSVLWNHCKLVFKYCRPSIITKKLFKPSFELPELGKTKYAKSIFKNYFKKLTHFSLSLACITDVCLIVFGGKFKRQERLSARCGDILSYMYLASSVIKFYCENNYNTNNNFNKEHIAKFSGKNSLEKKSLDQDLLEKDNTDKDLPLNPNFEEALLKKHSKVSSFKQIKPSKTHISVKKEYSLNANINLDKIDTKEDKINTILNKIDANKNKVDSISSKLGTEKSKVKIISDKMNTKDEHSRVNKNIIQKDAQQDAQDEIMFAKWSLDFCIYQITLALLNFLENFPNKFIAKILRIIIFPYGANIKYPDDKTSTKIAQVMMKSGSLRDRLLSFSFESTKEDDIMYTLELAFKQVPIVAPLLEKLKLFQKKGDLPVNKDFKAIVEVALKKGIINLNDMNRLLNFDDLRQEILSVDEF